MMKRAVVTIALATMFAASLPVGAVQAASAVRTYGDCAALREAFPPGVARDSRARQAAISMDMYPPTVNALVFGANSALDRNHDGVICSTPRHTLNSGDVEKAITRGLLKKIGPGPFLVTCPKAPPARKGYKFRCKVTDTSDGSRGIITVTLTDAEGRFNWEVTSASA